LFSVNGQTGIPSTVCSYNWEDDDATVVCKHLGMGTSGRAKNIDQDYNYNNHRNLIRPYNKNVLNDFRTISTDGEQYNFILLY
jgi:hypothetical protein